MNFTLHAISAFPADPAFLLSAGVAASVVIVSMHAMPARPVGPSASMVITIAMSVACMALLALSVASGLSTAQDERIRVIKQVETVTGLAHLIPMDDQLTLCALGAGEDATEYVGRNNGGEDVVALVRRGEEQGGLCEYAITLNP